MRSNLLKFLAMAILAITLLGAAALPGAGAQAGEGPDDEYLPLPPVTPSCVDVPLPTLELIGTTIVLTFPEIYLVCVTNILVVINPTLFDGPPPASRIIRMPLPVLEPREHTVTATATTVEGVEKIATLFLSAEQVEAINTALGAPGGAVGAGGDSVPAVITLPVPGLANTGGNIDRPLAIGTALIGAGGLALMVARKREQDRDVLG